MPTPPRRSVLLALGASLSISGCLAETAGENSPNETTSDAPATEGSPETTVVPSETTEKATALTETNSASSTETDVDSTVHASDSPDPDHEITAANRSDEPRTVRVWVVRDATGETVFETTVELQPGTETQALYNLKQADPDGIEAFRICGKPKGGDAQSESCATMRTNSCYANAHVTVQDDGSVQVIYAIC